jgi:hypothetical protein
MTEPDQQTQEIQTIEEGIHEMARRLTSDFFLNYIRDKVNSNENVKCVLKIKRGSNLSGYAVTLEHTTETQYRSFGLLKKLK